MQYQAGIFQVPFKNDGIEKNRKELWKNMMNIRKCLSYIDYKNENGELLEN